MKAIALLSGGIDSPVASYLMMKQNCEVVLSHFHNYTQESYPVKKKILDLREQLSRHQKNLKLYLIPFLEMQRVLLSYVPSDMRMIVYRRIMFRASEKIMEKEGAEALVTGDSVGQVASQTLDNIRVIYEAADKPVLSPLLGLDKEEIIQIAKEIGTYDISIKPYNDCCSYLIADRPETHAKLEKIEEAEKPIPIENLIENILGKAEVVD